MKKLVLVLCTVMAICCAGSAFAATSDGTLQEGSTSRNNNTILQGSVENKAAMPCFRAGDTLNFSVSGLSGSQLTIISYKVDKDIANETVQYIDQRTISGDDTDTIKYVIRDIDQGIYRVAVKDSNSSVYNLYYKVGTPKVETVKKGNMNYFIKQTNSDGTYSIGYVGKANMGSKDVSFADAGVKSFGFNYGGYGTHYLNDSQMAEIYDELDKKITQNEINGEYSVYFVQTIYSIPESDLSTAESINAEAVMTDTTTSESNTAE